MYDLGPSFEHATVDPGTNVLITGPPLSGKRRVALEILATGAEADEGAIMVSTRDHGPQVAENFRSMLNEEPPAFGIVDCISRHLGRPNADAESVAYASSPIDLTGIGIEFSTYLEEFQGDQGIPRNRVALDSLTTLLMYGDLQTVFRFMHVFTGRVESADALGLYAIEAGAHDTQTISTLRQLFDRVIETAPDQQPTLD